MTHVTDGVMDDIVWIQGTRMPWFNTRLGHLKKEKKFYKSSICIIYLMYNIYCINLICILYILYITYIYVESKVGDILIGLHLQYILGDPCDRWCYG